MPDMQSDGRPHAVVIGSGFGGLAAAVRLGARGYRVTVLEKLDAPGGRAYVFRQDGFTFDAGPTIITAPYLLEESVAGRRPAAGGRRGPAAGRSLLQDPLR
ncbi:NAD(P)-binding protein [Dankookia sp. P2]|uniref:NAD(P)-binding protein n=1 Tax=Dankookia sp. P2 TaxID=3423955 RepID=UPI003D664886